MQLAIEHICLSRTQDKANDGKTLAGSETLYIGPVSATMQGNNNSSILPPNSLAEPDRIHRLTANLPIFRESTG
jgi:hypothetical protein